MAGDGDTRRRLLAGGAKALGGLAALALAGWPGLASAGSFEDFFRALDTDDAATVAALLRKGFDPNAVDAHGNSALYLALQHHALKTARLLIEQPGLRVDQRNAAGETALMIACLLGESDIAKALLARGAAVDPPLGKPAWTALSYAAANGHDDLVRLLLSHAARVDQAAANGTTPLMMAAYFGHTSTVRLLLGVGADPKRKNAMGFDAMDLALQRGHQDTAEALGSALGGGRKPGQW